MAKRRWTLVLVPHDSEPSKVVELSCGTVKAAAAGAIVLVVAALLVGAARLPRRVDLNRSPHLEQENQRLSIQLAEPHGRFTTLSDTVGRFSQRDAKIRL